MRQTETDILVLCVDRDDDLGKKASIIGPVIGRNNNIEAATKLGLSDPEDSDVNSMFEAVKIYDKLKKEGRKVEVVTLTGHRDVGVKSDMEIETQIRKIAADLKPEKAIFVSDGVEDERLLPVVSSHVPIVSVRRIVVKQSERLEGIYYMSIDFFRRIMENPKLERMFIGIPAIILILYAIFDTAAFKLMLGVTGGYLFIKAFHLDGYIFYAGDEIRNSLSGDKAGFFFYIVSIALGIVAFARGYDSLKLVAIGEWLKTGAVFIYYSVFLFYGAFFLSLIGNALSSKANRKGLAKRLTYAVLGISVSLVLYSSAELLLNPGTGYTNLVTSIFMGLLLTASSIAFEKRI